MNLHLLVVSSGRDDHATMAIWGDILKLSHRVVLRLKHMYRNNFVGG